MTSGPPRRSPPAAGSCRRLQQRLVGLRTALLIAAGPWLLAAACCLTTRAEEVLSLKVSARMVDGQRKLDRELVQAVASTGSESDSAAAAGGRVVPAAWNPFDPPAGLIDPALEHLRGDIGVQPGRGCANGRRGR
jgi:hypothetical protein